MSLHFTEQGSGTPIVLLHAFPLSSGMWKADVPRLAKFGRVIAPDLPGFGGSARLPQPSMAGMAKEVEGLLESLNIRQPVVLAGLSMGGYAAFEFLRQFPERVKALGLFSTKAAPDTPQQKEGRFKLVERLEKGGTGILREVSLPKLVGSTTAAKSPDVVAEVERLAMANEVGGVMDALSSMANRADSRPLTASIKCPVLVLAGAEDAVIPAEESRQMAVEIKGAQFVLIPGAGHLVNLEQREKFQGALESWLGSILK